MKKSIQTDNNYLLNVADKLFIMVSLLYYKFKVGFRYSHDKYTESLSSKVKYSISNISVRTHRLLHITAIITKSWKKHKKVMEAVLYFLCFILDNCKEENFKC